jgi:aminoglycoside phosphotransferase (APT) family kinase protein
VIEGEPEAGHGRTGVPVIDVHLVRRLVDSQFPQWAGLPVRPVEFGGIDNRTFRLGNELSVRLPSRDWYSLQVDKEQHWLPLLAPQLPLPIPTPVARGVPGHGYPHSWSVYRWIEGRTATREAITDLTVFAMTLAGFLVALQRADATGGPQPGPHNFYRGGPLTTYAEETLSAIDALGTEVDRDQVNRVWEHATASRWHKRPVWLHGDIAVGNLLLDRGRLAAVIDFGTSGVGDPACDVVIAWTLLSGDSRTAFRAALGVDPATWSRGRGWCLWKALISLQGALDDPVAVQTHRQVIDAVLSDFAAAS